MKIVNLLKLTAHIRFVYVRFHILKMTKHPEDGTIRSCFEMLKELNNKVLDLAILFTGFVGELPVWGW